MDDAVEKLASLFEGNTEQERSTGFCTTDFKAILAAIQADPLAYVKPKLLVWVDHGEGNRWTSETLLGLYRVYDMGSGYPTPRFHALIGNSPVAHSPALEAAQAAAYDDLCKRMKELF